MTRRRALTVALLIVLAGCAAVPTTSPTSAPAPATSTPTPEPTPTATLTPTASPTPVPENPWRQRTVVVAVEQPITPNRTVLPLIRAALDYWRPRMNMTAYQVGFNLQPAADDPDLIVRFTDGILCGEYNESEALGCAPVVNDSVRVERPEEMEIRVGYSDESTLRTLKHEFGHVLGLEHDDAPQSIMAPRQHQAATLPQLNATDRRWPWRDATVGVYVDMSQATGTTAIVDRQASQAIDYYDRGGGGLVPENRSVVRVETRSEADVVVRFNDVFRDCVPGEWGSCGHRFGMDPDNDTALEYYTNGTIVLNAIDERATAWHIAYWLGFMLGAEDRDELPEPLQDASYEERRGPWWAEDD